MSSSSHEPAVPELTLAIGLLVRRMRSAEPSEASELSWTQRSVVGRLAREGPATIAELARAEGVKPQSMGTAIVGLEELGMIERKPHATDGRQVNIALTASGAALRKVAKDAKRSWLSKAIAQLDKKDQETLFAATEIIRRLVRS
jgi:DNA-binding MarR family transcriptional regulator